MQDIQELLLKDREATARAKREHPEGFHRAPLVDTREVLRSVGIEAGIPEEAPLGCIKLFPQDFIVEEIQQDGAVISVGESANAAMESNRLPTLYMDLVKCNMETLEARDRIARLLNIPEQSVGYSGIKDRIAITAQQISLRGVKEVPAITEDNFFLRFSHWGKGVLRPGYLKGNRFTITVRMRSEEDARAASESLDRIKTRGFWNFYYLQRFAAPRLLGHKVGKAVVTRAYEEAIRIMITEPGMREFPYFADMRREAKNLWGSWKELYERFGAFPYQFRYEREVLSHLIHHPADYLGALKEVPDHIKLCIYSYQSYLWNRLLSELIAGGNVPRELPFPSMAPELYRHIFQEEGIRGIEMPQFLISRMGVPDPVPAFVKPDMHAVHIHGSLLIISFSLTKGAYATSLLMHAIQIASDTPVPEGIPRDQIDAPLMIGRAPIAPVLKRFESEK